MNDLRDKIKKIIKKEKAKGHFWVLDTNQSVDLIQQILENYEKTNGIKQDFTNLPKKGELIFIAAPTGAGKDNLVIKLNYQNPEKKYIELNMDIFRHYYPMFIKDKETLTDKTFATKTNEFSYEIYITVQEMLLQEFPGTNIIITGTLRETGWVERVLRRFKEDKKTDYDVKMVCLAVPKKESALSVIKRYISIVDNQKEKEDFYPGTARYTSLSYHDETFEKFPKNLAYFQKKFTEKPGKLIDIMEVYRRSKDVEDLDEDTRVYSSQSEQSGRTTLDAVEELRKKPYEISYNEGIAILKKIAENVDYLKSQGTLKDVMRDSAVLLNYPNIVEKIDQFTGSEVEHDFNEKII